MGGDRGPFLECACISLLSAPRPCFFFPAFSCVFGQQKGGGTIGGDLGQRPRVGGTSYRSRSCCLDAGCVAMGWVRLQETGGRGTVQWGDGGARGSTWRGRGGDHKPFLLSAPGRLVHWGPCQENVSGKSGQKQVPSVKRVALASSSFQGRHRHLVHRAGGRHCGSCRRRCRLRRAVARRWGAVTGREGVAVRAEHAREGARGCLQRGKRSRAGKAKKDAGGDSEASIQTIEAAGFVPPATRTSVPRARPSQPHATAHAAGQRAPTLHPPARDRQAPETYRQCRRERRRVGRQHARQLRWPRQQRQELGAGLELARSVLQGGGACTRGTHPARQGWRARRPWGTKQQQNANATGPHNTSRRLHVSSHAQQPSKRAHPPCPRRRPAAACRAHAPWGHV